MVGSKDRKSLWLLSREKTMPEEVRKDYEAIAEAEGFPIEKLVDSKF